MSEPFHLKTVGGGLWMDFRDFIRLVNELQKYGVDAEIENQGPDGTAEFRLLEKYHE